MATLLFLDAGPAMTPRSLGRGAVAARKEKHPGGDAHRYLESNTQVGKIVITV